MLLRAIVASLVIIAAQAQGKETYGNVTVDSVRSIYGGDTFRVDIDSWPDLIGKHIPIRVNGINTPEMRGECEKEKQQARKAKQLTVEALRSAKKIELRNIQRGKYFRIVADVYVDGQSLKDRHLKAGTAREYSGGRKEGWCD